MQMLLFQVTPSYRQALLPHLSTFLLLPSPPSDRSGSNPFLNYVINTTAVNLDEAFYGTLLIRVSKAHCDIIDALAAFNQGRFRLLLHFLTQILTQRVTGTMKGSFGRCRSFSHPFRKAAVSLFLRRKCWAEREGRISRR